MFTPKELAAFRARIRAAVDANDLVTLGGMIGVEAKDVEANREKIEAVLHKHRLEMDDKSRADRVASLEWLRARGHKRLMDRALPSSIDGLRKGGG